MEEHSSMTEHVVKMSDHVQRLNDLEFKIPDEVAIDRVLRSLPPSYESFLLKCDMQGMVETLSELFTILKIVELEIKKEHSCTKYLEDKKAGKVAGRDMDICDIHVIYVFQTSARSNVWIFDTGSIPHICNSQEGLQNKRILRKNEVTMRVGNGAKVDVMSIGTLRLSLPSGLILVLNNCYYVPVLSMNIVSGSCLIRDHYSFKSETTGCSIYKNNVFYVHAPVCNGLFLMDLEYHDSHINNIEAKRLKPSNEEHMTMWHCRLGHIGIKRMEKLHKDGLLESLDFGPLDTCEPCLMGKMTRTPFNGTMERAVDLLGIIHTDVCGPMNVTARNGFRYFVTFPDDLSRYGYIYLMKHKSETFEKFKEFQSEVENQLGKKIKNLRSDRGGEYLSHEFGTHLKTCGIVPQLTPAGTPQRNGVAERRNRTLLDSVRSMMSHTDLPVSFWGYALETAIHILNRVPSKSVKTTPFEEWHGTKPELSHLKIWGCEAYVRKIQPDKLESKADKCIFVGYPRETVGYTFYNQSEGKTFVAKTGCFLDKEFLSKELSGRKIDLNEMIGQSFQVEEMAMEVVPEPSSVVGAGENGHHDIHNDRDIHDDHDQDEEDPIVPRRSLRARVKT